MKSNASFPTVAIWGAQGGNLAEGLWPQVDAGAQWLLLDADRTLLESTRRRLAALANGEAQTDKKTEARSRDNSKTPRPGPRDPKRNFFRLQPQGALPRLVKSYADVLVANWTLHEPEHSHVPHAKQGEINTKTPDRGTAVTSADSLSARGSVVASGTLGATESGPAKDETPLSPPDLTKRLRHLFNILRPGVTSP